MGIENSHGTVVAKGIARNSTYTGLLKKADEET
jgi:hypothetical protein